MVDFGYFSNFLHMIKENEFSRQNRVTCPLT